MKKVLVIVGPTAVGKSDFALNIAEEINSEIISGDSIQVYRGLNIGSGKVTSAEMNQVPHHLIDILSADENYSVADFQKKSRQCIEKITNENKLPIVVGGTGLYIKACLYDYVFSDELKSDEDVYNDLDNETLYAMLKEIDEKATETIHKNNRKRVIRALTIAGSGKTKSDIEAEQNHTMIYDVLLIGLTCSRETLYKRINNRVDKMINLGLKEEIEKLISNKINFCNQSMQGIGYREWKDYFENNASENEVIEKIKTHSRQFAKRQYTWFNNQMKIKWLDIEEENWQEKGMELISKWRNSHE